MSYACADVQITYNTIRPISANETGKIVPEGTDRPADIKVDSQSNAEDRAPRGRYSMAALPLDSLSRHAPVGGYGGAYAVAGAAGRYGYGYGGAFDAQYAAHYAYAPAEHYAHHAPPQQQAHHAPPQPQPQPQQLTHAHDAPDEAQEKKEAE
ncbi:hypothetical protein EVAR_53335_1 [Eumeta japonica]|uniref:Uncharacterized protein n=1 Tax=Eumeta variegata TaxID=151549 RepID=A0A4C1X5Z4_EUMVA|nr:hypothetical protein EVAR_53335_1 [Eumeta japonica]